MEGCDGYFLEYKDSSKPGILVVLLVRSMRAPNTQSYNKVSKVIEGELSPIWNHQPQWLRHIKYFRSNGDAQERSAASARDSVPFYSPEPESSFSSDHWKALREGLIVLRFSMITTCTSSSFLRHLFVLLTYSLADCALNSDLEHSRDCQRYIEESRRSQNCC
jgi:hypothetical protein